MQTLKLEIEDSNVDIVLNISHTLEEQKEFINISQKSLSAIWDNNEDIIYDKFLKI